MRAAEAAKNTAVLIEGTVNKIQDGSKLVSRTDAAFVRVAETSFKVGELVGSIAEASKDQSQGIEQVNASVTKMDKDVQQNAATSEESALASEKMNAQAGKMKGFVKGLTVLIGGNSDDTEGKQRTFTKRYSTQSKSDQRDIDGIVKSPI